MMMTCRECPAGVVLLTALLACASASRPAHAQEFGAAPPPRADEDGRITLQVAAGPTAIDRGVAVAAGVGYSPWRWLDAVANVERVHVPVRTTRHEDGYSISRGGTRTFASGELRVRLTTASRISPFAVAGAGLGVSRPNEGEPFADAEASRLHVAYVGGGVQMALGRGLSLTADARAMVAVDGYDSVAGMWPVRAGLVWRF